MPPILFWNPENGSGEDSRVWWRIPVSLQPSVWNSKPLDECSVHLQILRSGAVTDEHEMCWQTSEGPQRLIHIEPNTIYSIPVAIRSVGGEGDPVVVDANRRISFPLPAHFPIVTNVDVILEGKIPATGLSNRDYVMQLLIRRKRKTIRKSELYVLNVPPNNKDNRYFALHLRTLPEFKMPCYRQRAQL